jgi:hypothetical protein
VKRHPSRFFTHAPVAAPCAAVFCAAVFCAALSGTRAQTPAATPTPPGAAGMALACEALGASGIGLFWPDTNRPALHPGGTIPLDWRANDIFPELSPGALPAEDIGGAATRPVTLRVRDADSAVEFRDAQSNVIHTVPPSSGAAWSPDW